MIKITEQTLAVHHQRTVTETRLSIIECLMCFHTVRNSNTFIEMCLYIHQHIPLCVRRRWSPQSYIWSELVLVCRLGAERR